MNKDIYYIYVLQLTKDTEPNKTRYYVGKTHHLPQRIHDHLNKNRKSTKLLKAHDITIIGLDSVYRINIANENELTDQALDSITSRIENIVVTKLLNDNTDSTTIYRGGCYLTEWETTDFPMLSLKSNKYKSLIPLKELTKISCYENICINNYKEVVTRILNKPNEKNNTNIL